MAGLLFLLAVLLTVDGKEIHVSSNGSDDDGCGFPNSPCQTLEFIASDLLTNNTQIIINKRCFKFNIATSPNDDEYIDHDFPVELFNCEDIQVKSYGSVHNSK